MPHDFTSSRKVKGAWLQSDQTLRVGDSSLWKADSRARSRGARRGEHRTRDRTNAALGNAERGAGDS